MEKAYRELNDILTSNLANGEYEDYDEKNINQAALVLSGDVALGEKDTNKIVSSVVMNFNATSKSQLPKHLRHFKPGAKQCQSTI